MSEAPFDAGPGDSPAGAPGPFAEAEPPKDAPHMPLVTASPVTPARSPFERPPGPGWTQVPGRVPAEARERSWFAAAVARGLALFVGVVTLVSMAGYARTAVFDVSVWWIVVPLGPRYLGACLLGAAGVAFVAYAIVPQMPAWRRWLTLALLVFVAAVAVWNGVRFFLSWRAGDIHPQVPLPLSLVLAVLLGFVVWAALRDPPKRGWPAVLTLVVTVALGVVLFAPAIAVSVGTTDYRRPADVVVVTGAAVDADGSPSAALSERMATAVELYKSGLVKRIIVSGGVGKSGYNEALVMRDMAVQGGVPAKKVVVDSNGVDMGTTVADTVAFFGGPGWQKILAVDQADRSPLLRLAYQRAGWDVLTVPAGGSSSPARTVWRALREVPSFWLYYLRAVLG